MADINDQTRETMAKAEKVLADTLLLEAQRLHADSVAGKLLNKAEPDAPTDPSAEPGDEMPGEPPTDVNDDMGEGGELPEDISHDDLVAQFRQMAPEQLQAYRMALDEAIGNDGDADPDDADPEAGSDPSLEEAEPMDMGGGMPMQMSEAMAKSEQMFVQLQRQLSSMQGEVQRLRKSQTAAPAQRVRQRSVTGPTRPSTARPVELSKSEAEAILRRKLRDPSLSKGDRGLINDFVTGRTTQVAVTHLLKS